MRHSLNRVEESRMSPFHPMEKRFLTPFLTVAFYLDNDDGYGTLADV